MFDPMEKRERDVISVNTEVALMTLYDLML